MKKLVYLKAEVLGEVGMDLAKKVALKPGKNEYPATFLVGDKTYQGLYFPAEEIEKAADTMAGQPVNLDHSFRVEDEVGFVRHPSMFGKALRGLLVLSPGTHRFETAKTFIETRNAAEKPPEVSVGVLLDVEEEELPDGETRFVARNLQFDHLALVVRGACGPGDGCGVGLQHQIKPPLNFQEVYIVSEAEEHEEAPCACNDLDTIRAERDEALETITALENERDCLAEDVDDLAERLEVYEEGHLEQLTEEAEELSVPVEDSDDAESLEAKLEIARSIRESYEANAPARRRSKAGAGKEPDKATRVLAKMGLTDPEN